MNAFTKITQASSGPLAIAAASAASIRESDSTFDIIALCRRDPEFVPVYANGTLWAAASSQIEGIKPSPEAITTEDYVEGLKALGFSFHIMTREDESRYAVRGEPEHQIPDNWDRRAMDIMAAFGRRKFGQEVLDYLDKREADRVAAHPDADLFRMEKDYKAAMARYEVASKAHSEAEERYFAIRPAPIEKDEWPDDLKARYRAMTVADLSNKEHPVNVEIAALWKAYEQKVEAREKADQEASREAGVDRAEKPMNALLEKADAIARKIIRTRAHTPAGMLIKVRVNAASAVEEDVLHAAIIKDLRAAAKRQGGLS